MDNQDNIKLTMYIIVMITMVIVWVVSGIFSTKMPKIEQKELQALKEKKLNNESLDIIRMMLENVEELKEYYIISKQQARKSFTAAIIICFAGFFLYVLGIISNIFLNIDINIIAIISGTVIEIISALFFWLYKNATVQLERYHRRLEKTERYLIAYKVIKEEVPEEEKYTEQRNYITYILNDNQYEIKREAKDLEKTKKETKDVDETKKETKD